MPKTFNWIYLGKSSTFIDEKEGNSSAERAPALNNTTWGNQTQPLYQRVVSATTLDKGGVSGVLDTNNHVTNDGYRTDIGNGAQVLNHDASAVYTLDIIYADGTTARSTATVAQSTDGHLFLAPPRSGYDGYLSTKPILSVQLSGATQNTNVNFDDDRSVIGWDDGVVEGTAGNDLIDNRYVEPVASGSDAIDGNDAVSGSGRSDDVVKAGAGNDTVLSGLGNDSVLGEAGNDNLDGGAGNDTVLGDSGADSIQGGAGNDVLYGDDIVDVARLSGDDTIDGGSGDDRINGGSGDDLLAGGDGSDTVNGDAGDDVIGGGTLSGTGLADDNKADTLNGGEGFDRFIAGNGDLITDFGLASGGNISDGNSANNDFVNLSGYYNDANLAVINNARVAAGQQPYATPLGWLRADQADGLLNDIRTGNGFRSSFAMRIENNGNPVAGDALNEETVNVICFAADVLIDTARGSVAAGDLRPGDLVLTRDNGPQQIRWIGGRRLNATDLAAAPHLRPVRIARGALGAGKPLADLVVSPQHRVLVRSRIAQKMFGTDEVLVAAKQLCQIDGIDVALDLDHVAYVHFLFDDHQIVLSNGAETESLHTGPVALNSVGPSAREEILSIFPELRDGTERPAARLLASGRMGRKLAVRHQQNRKPLVA